MLGCLGEQSEVTFYGLVELIEGCGGQGGGGDGDIELDVLDIGIVLVDSDPELKVSGIGWGHDGGEHQGLVLGQGGLRVQDEVLNGFIELRAYVRSTCDVVSSTDVLEHCLVNFQNHVSDFGSAKIEVVEGDVGDLVDPRVGEGVGNTLCIIVIVVGVDIGCCILVHGLRVQGDVVCLIPICVLEDGEH